MSGKQVNGGILQMGISNDFFFIFVLNIETRASGMLGKHFTTDQLYPYI